AMRLRVERVDLSAMGPATAAEEARLLGQELVETPFDLDRGPLLRAALVRVAPAERVLLMAFHHIVCDGWSLEILKSELAAPYRACADGRPSPLSALEPSYAEYMRERGTASPAADDDLRYWRERLAGFPTTSNVPPDRPRPAAPSYEGTLER